ncbi:aldose epimerase family protein [Streptomyces sp. SDT5-1]|uniref:aldose epimerase family protein n=1 Tax=Streptomyces sp. SDT5-1 TaxID=3406418 RepID=UPI003FCF71C7
MTGARRKVQAIVDDRGAELVSLRTQDGVELLWQAGLLWPWSAPVLFPVIGRGVRDEIQVHGVTFPMPKHGFARERTFARTETGHVLVDDAETRAAYPFAFRLEVVHETTYDTVTARYEVTNPGPDPLPYALGVHTAFSWPLPGAQRVEHVLHFDAPEPAPVRRVTGVLLRPETYPTPVHGRQLRLTPGLFADGAVVFDVLESRTLALRAQGAPELTIRLLEGFTQLAVWSPGSDLLCVEPWGGLPSPKGYTGELVGRPGMHVLPPGRARSFAYSITVGSDD